MKVYEVNDQRFSVALDLFNDGKRLDFDKVSYLLGDDNVLSISIQTSWQSENESYARVLANIDRARQNFKYLLESSERFRSIVGERLPEYSLIDDYGTGTLELGRLIADRFIWNRGHPLATSN